MLWKYDNCRDTFTPLCVVLGFTFPGKTFNMFNEGRAGKIPPSDATSVLQALLKCNIVSRFRLRSSEFTLYQDVFVLSIKDQGKPRSI